MFSIGIFNRKNDRNWILSVTWPTLHQLKNQSAPQFHRIAIYALLLISIIYLKIRSPTAMPNQAEANSPSSGKIDRKSVLSGRWDEEFNWQLGINYLLTTESADMEDEE